MTTAEPLIAPPVEKPAPVQDAALVELHDRVDGRPGFTDVGFADSDTAGTGGGGGAAATLTVAVAVEDPPFPEQVTEYVAVALGVTTAEPEVPDAVKPAPVQDVALVELHERFDDCPAVIDEGLAESEAVGAGGGGEVATEEACRCMPLLANPADTR